MPSKQSDEFQEKVYSVWDEVTMNNQSQTRLCHNPEQNFETEFLIFNLN